MGVLDKFKGKQVIVDLVIMTDDEDDSVVKGTLTGIFVDYDARFILIEQHSRNNAFNIDHVVSVSDGHESIELQIMVSQIQKHER